MFNVREVKISIQPTFRSQSSNIKRCYLRVEPKDMHNSKQNHQRDIVRASRNSQ